MSVDYEEYWEHGKYQPSSLGGEFWETTRRFLPTETFKLLDYGCGNCAAFNDLASLNCRYTGVDVSNAAIKSPLAKGIDCHLINDDGSLPLEPSSFDILLSSCVVEHIVNAAEAYRSALRYLRPGGLCVIRTNNMMHWRLRLDYLLLGRWNPYGDDLSVEQPWRDPHVRFFTGDSLIRFGKAVGLTDLMLTGDSGRLAHWLPIMGRLFANKRPSKLSRYLSQKLPRLFAGYITIIGKKPQ
jgi:SAM-dependent methyltransferase